MSWNFEGFWFSGEKFHTVGGLRTTIGKNRRVSGFWQSNQLQRLSCY